MTAEVVPETLPPRRPPRWLAIGLIVLVGASLYGINYGRGVIAEIAATLPKTPDAATMPMSTAVVDRNGALLRPFTTSDGKWRLPIAVKDVDRRYVEMLLAYEDQNFEHHHGVDWTSMLRAAGQYVLASGHIVS